jgi:hypothetical protein
MDKIIGRKAEQKQILESFSSDKSELVAVYGRLLSSPMSSGVISL